MRSYFPRYGHVRQSNPLNLAGIYPGPITWRIQVLLERRLNAARKRHKTYSLKDTAEFFDWRDEQDHRRWSRRHQRQKRPNLAQQRADTRWNPF